MSIVFVCVVIFRLLLLCCCRLNRMEMCLQKKWPRCVCEKVSQLLVAVIILNPLCNLIIFNL
jgi:hypothetical protein